jgi:hypothetical protein
LKKVPEAIMQAAWAALPEFNFMWRKHPPTPVRWSLYIAASKTLFSFSHSR